MPAAARLPPVIVADDRTAPTNLPIPDGWSRHAGFALPTVPVDLSDRRWICVGLIDDRASARRAVEALERGAGVAVAIELVGSERLDLLEDLNRAGTPWNSVGVAVLDADQRVLLDHLAAGATMSDAAAAADVSVRTAHRRVADARRRLGVATTVEAVVRRDDRRS